MINHGEIRYSDLLKKIKAGGNWRVITSINFEECSMCFLRDLLKILDPADLERVSIVPFRLVSSRATPWSVLEIVKQQFDEDVKKIAKDRKLPLRTIQVDYPATIDATYNLIFDSAMDVNCNIVVDYSALPKQMGVYITDMLCGLQIGVRKRKFGCAFVVITPPEKLLDRTSLGPFSVGLAKPLYHDETIRRTRHDGKLSLLIFPGWEGFEAKQTVDEYISHNTSITVAFGVDSWALNSGLRELVSNQAVLTDCAENLISVSFYFSPADAFRLADDVVKRAVALIDEFRSQSHGLLIAPYGPKWSLLCASYARQRFLERAKMIAPEIDVFSDVVTLSTSQYVSTHSRGAGDPMTFEIARVND